MQQPWYCTREQVKRALDFNETARNNAQIDRAITSASRTIDQLCHRTFYPYDGVKYFPYPVRDSTSLRLWFDATDVVSLTSVVSGGTTISSSDYFLEPINTGPPYTSMEIDQSSSSSFAGGDTFQRSLVLTGTFGFWDEQEQVGTLSNNLDADVSDTASITWSDPADIGVGSILKIDSERLIISDTSFVDSTQNLGGSGLTASNANVTVTVTDSTGFYVGELIRIDSEVMLVVDIGAATSITVKRAYDGSVLASHSAAADIYGKTGIEIARAQLGSSLAAHTTSDVVYRWVVPELVNELAIAEASVHLLAGAAGYARQSGSGEAERSVFGAGIGSLRTQVKHAYGRQLRHRAI